MLVPSIRLRARPVPRAASAGPSSAPAGDGPLGASACQALLAMPFDALRFQYAGAVIGGVAPRSLIASGQWERALDAMEKLVLGPLARQR
jgi:hypothetical protein